MYSSMIFNQMKKEKKGIEKQIQKGNLKPVLDWLREKIHKHGSMKLADELIQEVCGKSLSEKDFLEYLDEKYSKIYSI
jgi:carboxypeptidase Taq